MPGTAYRLSFRIGMSLLAASVALGVVSAAQQKPPLPLLPEEAPLVSARRAYADDPGSWLAAVRAMTWIQPRQPGPHLVLGKALADADRIGPAIEAFERAAALGEPTGLANAWLARLYLQSGDRVAARERALAARRQGAALPGGLRSALGIGGPGSER